ncbi:YidB family protein [Roseiarcus sp.]|uniref:YidB family protein n=1 Tax=Roseiarcus sp. TaxID=1969460 RepID=UPI003F9803E1
MSAHLFSTRAAIGGTSRRDAVEVIEEEAMGMFDDAMKNSVPGGNLATPIAVAVGALILGKLFGGGSSPAPASSAPAPTPIPTDVPSSSILDGLGGLIGKLTAGGAGQHVNTWVGPGQNQPIEPGQLGGALGGNVLDELSRRTGMSQQELLNQLATVLPQLINNLTPKGRMPTLADLDER